MAWTIVVEARGDVGCGEVAAVGCRPGILTQVAMSSLDLGSRFTEQSSLVVWF